MGNSNFGTNYPVWYKMEPPLIGTFHSIQPTEPVTSNAEGSRSDEILSITTQFGFFRLEVPSPVHAFMDQKASEFAWMTAPLHRTAFSFPPIFPYININKKRIWNYDRIVYILLYNTDVILLCWKCRGAAFNRSR